MTAREVSFFITLFHIFSRTVPRSFHPFFTSLGNHLVFFILRRYREAVKENLRIIGRGAYTEKDVSRLAKRCFQNYSLKLLDYMSMDRLNFRDRTRWVGKEMGEEHLEKALERGKGVICVTPHLGNWELGGYVLAQKGYPIHILTLKEESPFLSRYEKDLRQRVGIHTIVIDPKERPNFVILEIARQLKKNEIVAMVADRIYDGQGVEVDFFGQPTPFPTGPIYLALETGAEVIPVFVILKEKMKYWGIIEEPIPINREIDKEKAVRLGVQEMGKRFEKIISQYPDQWLTFFPFWRNPNEPSPFYSVRGRINQHQILIQREPEVVYDLLTDLNQFKRCVPVEELSIEGMDLGEFRLGVRYHFKLQFRIRPEWDTEVIFLERPRQIVYQFLNGIFEGGVEIWDLKKIESGTLVTHTLLYQIKRWVYKMGWFLLGGEKKHNELTETTLKRLKSLLEERPG